VWFAFPPGVERIVVEQQPFEAQGKDELGRDCFNAPAHFAPRILALKGFAAAGGPVEPLPGAVMAKEPEDEAAISAMAKQAEADAIEIRGLREDAVAKTAALGAVTAERDQLKAALTTAELKIAALEADLEDKPAAPAPAPKK